MEAPTMLEATLSLPNRDPLANPLEVFEGDPPRGVFGFRDQLLTQAMVHITGEALFFPSPPFQQPLGGLGAFGLQLRSEARMTRPQPIQVCPRMLLTIGVGGNVDDSEVDTQPVVGIFRRRFWDIDNDGEIERPIPVEQVRLPAHPRQARGLVAAKYDGHALPSRHRQDRRAVHPFPRENPLVIDDSPVGAKGRLDRFIALVRLADLRNGADGQLRGEAKISPDLMIDELLKLHFIGGSFSEGNFRNSIACRVEAFHRLKQRGVLRGCWRKFHHQREVHILNDTVNYIASQEGKGPRASP